jgi:hypothetical protein
MSSDVGFTQSVGKAIGYESIIPQLQTMVGNNDAGIISALITNNIGEADEVWSKVLEPLAIKGSLATHMSETKSFHESMSWNEIQTLRIMNIAEHQCTSVTCLLFNRSPFMTSCIHPQKVSQSDEV